MRRRLARTRVTLQVEKLPPEAFTTELDYRTRVTTARQDSVTTIRLMLLVTLGFVAVGFVLRLASVLSLFYGVVIIAAIALRFAGRAFWYFLVRRRVGRELAIVSFLVVVAAMFGLVNVAPTTEAAYLVVFGGAVVSAVVLAHFVAKQACAFMAANERIERPKVLRWEEIWWDVISLRTPSECPEVADYRMSVFGVGAAFLIGFGALRLAEARGYEAYAAILGVLAFVASLPLLWTLLADLGIVSKCSPERAAVVTWRMLTTFVCYNRHQVEAAGLFRFPTMLLRRPLHRDAALTVVLGLLATALVAVSVSSPHVLIDRYRAGGEKPEQAVEESSGLSTAEAIFAGQLPAAARDAYLKAKTSEKKEARWADKLAGAEKAFWRVVATTALVLTVCVLGPPLVFFAILWFLAGRLLVRYWDALEAPDAYERPTKHSPKELAAGARDVLPWDNRIDRIHQSGNSLEREHLYLGSSIEGDFPVLVHEELLYGHGHILGDTGSRKTSIGITPLLTQLIAREEASIVILDLKGDMTLFEAAKEEAEAAGTPFKYFTTQLGRSSYVFNPLRQSHTPFQTTNQLSQNTLQALSLEYGDDYGRGFFSSLNEVVLSTYLRHNREIGSFRELSELVSMKEEYRGIGEIEDWEKTRHLASITDKLAQITPLNVTEGPGVKTQIDMPSVLRERQVIYFYLASALEPTTVSAVAKLVMFSLLTAALMRERGQRQRTYVFIDEFQRVVSQNVAIFFEQARQKRVHFLLANQSIGQLEKNGVDLTAVVESCTAFKQSFRASDEKSMKRLIEASGEAVYHEGQWKRIVSDSFDEERDDDYLSLDAAMRNTREGIVEETVTERVGPRLEKNTVIETSALPLASFVRFTEGSGFTQFSGFTTTVLSEYHITKTLYEFREEADWPEVTTETVLVTAEDTTRRKSTRFLDKKVAVAKPRVRPKPGKTPKTSPPPETNGEHRATRPSSTDAPGSDAPAS